MQHRSAMNRMDEKLGVNLAKMKDGSGEAKVEAMVDAAPIIHERKMSTDSDQMQDRSATCSKAVRGTMDCPMMKQKKQQKPSRILASQPGGTGR